MFLRRLLDLKNWALLVLLACGLWWNRSFELGWDNFFVDPCFYYLEIWGCDSRKLKYGTLSFCGCETDITLLWFFVVFKISHWIHIQPVSFLVMLMISVCLELAAKSLVTVSCSKREELIDLGLISFGVEMSTFESPKIISFVLSMRWNNIHAV